MAALSAVLVIERTALLRALKPLVGAALVASRHEGERRRQTFALTGAGETKIAQAHAHWLEAQEAFERRFRPRRRPCSETNCSGSRTTSRNGDPIPDRHATSVASESVYT